jgi:hypothetical protein
MGVTKRGRRPAIGQETPPNYPDASGSERVDNRAFTPVFDGLWLRAFAVPTLATAAAVRSRGS